MIVDAFVIFGIILGVYHIIATMIVLIYGS